MERIVKTNRITELCRELRKKQKTIVTTNGCFDLLHLGHIRYLTQTAALGDILIVCVNSDTSVRRLKGAGRPFNPAPDRAEILAALRPVDYTVIFEEDDPRVILEAIQPDIHVKGGDYRADELIEAATVRKYGGKIKIIPFVGGKSTSALINKMGGLK